SLDPDRSRQARRSEDARGDGGPPRGDRAPACVALAPQEIPGDAADPRHDVDRPPRGEPGSGRHRAERRRVPAAQPVTDPGFRRPLAAPEAIERRGSDPPSRPRGPLRGVAEDPSSRPPRRTRRRRTRAAAGPAWRYGG